MSESLCCMEAALDELDEIAGLSRHATVAGGREYNLAWAEWLNVRSILTVAKLTTLGAFTRTESRGSHYRTDYPQRSDATWLCNILLQAGDDGVPIVRTRAVALSRLEP